MHMKLTTIIHSTHTQNYVMVRYKVINIFRMFLDEDTSYNEVSTYYFDILTS
jgi:hypothetical protein